MHLYSGKKTEYMYRVVELRINALTLCKLYLGHNTGLTCKTPGLGHLCVSNALTFKADLYFYSCRW